MNSIAVGLNSDVAVLICGAMKLARSSSVSLHAGSSVKADTSHYVSSQLLLWVDFLEKAESALVDFDRIDMLSLIASCCLLCLQLRGRQSSVSGDWPPTVPSLVLSPSTSMSIAETLICAKMISSLSWAWRRLPECRRRP